MVIQNRVTPPDWTDEEGGGEEGARCRLFPITRDSDGLVRNDAWFQDAAEARPICNGDFIGTPCPVRASCLLISLINNDQNGVYGGMTVPQRRWIRRNVPKDLWRGDGYLRRVTPDPVYFNDLGDEDPDADQEAFEREQAEVASKEE